MEQRTDSELGKRVHADMINAGIETPMKVWPGDWQDYHKKRIEEYFYGIMVELGLDMMDDSLSGTPERVARMYLEEIFSGLNYDKFPACTVIANKMYTNDEFVLEKSVKIHSTCEHHFVVIDGYAHIAYVPKKKVIGLSKLNRIADFFAKRPQVQERLNRQIAQAIATVAECDDVAVLVNAVHYCVKARGIRDQSSETVTFAALGRFAQDTPLRRDFLDQSRA